MGSIIRMDIYRLLTSLSFKICLGAVFLFNLAIGPVGKLIYNISKMILENSDSEESKQSLAKMGEWVTEFHFGNLIAEQLGIFCTVLLLLCIVYFCYADIQHGYIKNIAGQLPSRGHTVVSKFAVIQFTILVFYLVSVIGNVIGQFIIGRSIRFDLYYPGDLDLETMTRGTEQTFSMLYAAAEFGIKFLLLSGVCSLILLLTTGVGSNVAGTIVAVVFGAGVTGLLYNGISAGINKLLNPEKSFDLGDYMPDSLYRTDLFREGAAVRGLISGIVTIVVLMFLTTRLYNKKDIK